MILHAILSEKVMRLAFGIKALDEIFYGFEQGDFAVLHGDSVVSMLFVIAVRCQMPVSEGGLSSAVVFVDGGNSFRLYEVSEIAHMCKLDPAKILQGVFISRAFTAHQMTSIIMERLEEAVEKHDSKLVLVSDLAGLYLDSDVSTEEATQLFIQATSHLSKLAEKRRVSIVTTYPLHKHSRRNCLFHAILCGRAKIVISLRKSKRFPGNQFFLEKHPSLCLGQASLPFQESTLDCFD